MKFISAAGEYTRNIVLRERLEQVEHRIQDAAHRVGRPRSEVTLIAVTKKIPADVIRDAYSLGLRYFGENYVQEFETKHPALADLRDAQFHLIGHLQSNKARPAAELFQVIQTVDSEKLARRLDQIGRPLEVMIEVKLSGEESKSGAAPEALPMLIDAIGACPNLRLGGLMTMPPWSEDPAVTRPYFRRLSELGRRYGLKKLSMGMSHDLEAAIEEGATHIRVGTALFGPRRKDLA
jgi:PLP dependent protein